MVGDQIFDRLAACYAPTHMLFLDVHSNTNTHAQLALKISLMKWIMRLSNPPTEPYLMEQKQKYVLMHFLLFG